MKLTPDQRRQRLLNIIAENPDFAGIKASLDPAKAWFDQFTARLPGPLRNRLREYPGMFYFLHQRMIDTVCKQMKFQDED
ncbi:MAG: hypothetical protein IJZ39_13540 [Oscillospiraceae bacterium]|nr:hypothetical protein [Oscillospiraceae bacterium]